MVVLSSIPLGPVLGEERGDAENVQMLEISGFPGEMLFLDAVQGKRIETRMADEALKLPLRGSALHGSQMLSDTVLESKPRGSQFRIYSIIL